MCISFVGYYLDKFKSCGIVDISKLEGAEKQTASGQNKYNIEKVARDAMTSVNIRYRGMNNWRITRWIGKCLMEAAQKAGVILMTRYCNKAKAAIIIERKEQKEAERRMKVGTCRRYG